MPDLSPEVLENETPPPRRRWPVVAGIAAFVAFVTAGVWFMVIEPRLARKDFERAVADWKAAGLGDPLVAPVAPPPVPDSRNLLKQPPFDGWGTMSGAPGGRTKLWEEVGYFVFFKPGVAGADFAFDPEAHFSNPSHGALSALLPVLKPAGVPATRVFIEKLESRLPELARVGEVAKGFPEMWIPAVNWESAISEAPMVFFKTARANSFALTAYSGCKILEGDGTPAASAVPLMVCYGETLGGRGTIIDAMVALVASKASVPRLVHAGLEKGVWSDTQLCDLLRALERARYAEFVRDAVRNECACLARVIEGASRGDAVSSKIYSKYTAAGMLTYSRPAGLLRRATILLDESRKVLVGFDKKSGYDAIRVMSAQEALAAGSLDDSVGLASLYCATFPKLVGNAARLDIELDTCALGCALELWRREHGAYPEKLDDLTPGILPVASPERVRGVKPAYARTATGYELRWTGGDVYEGCVVARMESSHPGPWGILGQDIKLPETWTMFDSHTFSKGSLTPKDIVWTMTAPAAGRVSSEARAKE